MAKKKAATKKKPATKKTTTKHTPVTAEDLAEKSSAAESVAESDDDKAFVEVMKRAGLVRRRRFFVKEADYVRLCQLAEKAVN